MAYAPDYRQRLDLQQAQERAAQREREEANQEARRAYLKGLESQAAEQRAARDAEDEALLQPERTRLQRQWLSDHPDRTETDFLNRAWPQLRRNLLEDKANGLRDAEIARMMKQGKHVL